MGRRGIADAGACSEWERARWTMESFDVVVVGAGDAELCAALAARRGNAKVSLIKPHREWVGGNSYFTAGAMRTPSTAWKTCARSRRPERRAAAITDLPPYRHDDFPADMRRVTEGRCDPELRRSWSTIPPTVRLAAREGHPLAAHVRSAVVRGRGAPSLLGQPAARHRRRRHGADRAAPRGGGGGGDRGALRPRRGRVAARRAGGGDRGGLRHAGGARGTARRRGGAGQRRLRGRPAAPRACTSGRTGTWRRCAAPPTTPARALQLALDAGAQPYRQLERLPRDPVGRRRADRSATWS